MTERISQFRNDGLTFDVVDSGPIDGDVVVLLHGFPQTAQSWSAVSELLHANGFRTIAPNQRGYSAGARPGGRRQYTAEKLTGDVAALIELTGGPVHLVGHDWGAAIAWSTAATRPELVRTLTSVSVPHPGAFLKSMVVGSQGLHSYYMGIFQLPKVGEWFARLAMPRSGMTPEALAASRAGVLDTPALTTAMNWYRALPFTRPSTAFTPVRRPTTHIWSDGDIALVRKGALLTEKYVEAPYRLEIVEGANHWLPDTHPELLARLITERAAP
ncbi:alpha/beta fold hydrolase [Mycobacterium sp. CBMA293]|uniref:alpha/beta fold hydrolase n=2 Tax=Mycolicibacterium TaxID=1866885 RepID=UPI00132795EB|nr:MULTISPECIES: alpha/beta fold hydrolase [unclassified Mycolicibacterium]MUL47356.1 alpha/beta fold hydrolase [Mycolicibacterium sp. CBMA 360]MUL96371.1 alpha/beta fold hydrolase [Mycolicibacterium sp. CBMA 230]MUL61469.1 alpha/beta fold hydrolase [Mycolicibacterium sp. CBMA 335]MUL72204.1 alpha/beta fold hydrolase [Mycolicibacterium sp. CBMA 311]MUM08806.1 alpha/beta hydrolase [Mycolicibacterium sp. CBMA 213]